VCYFEYNISFGSGRGFISLVSRARWSADMVGSRTDDDDDDVTDERELGRFWKLTKNGLSYM